MTCSYSDYTTTDSGLQYSDLKQGTGPAPGPNSLCTVDWDGAEPVKVMECFIPACWAVYIPATSKPSPCLHLLPVVLQVIRLGTMAAHLKPETRWGSRHAK